MRFPKYGFTFAADCWSPAGIRPDYATNVRKKVGLEAAQILLGHSSALITDAVYAERDAGKAMEIVGKIG